MNGQEEVSRIADGHVPVAVVMISLNEAHNMEAVLQNLVGWAQEIFLVDSYSADETVDIALRHGVHVVQRRFRGFGDQWNFALRELPVSAPWTMKLDPDERISAELKLSIGDAIRDNNADALTIARRLWFMGRPLPIRQPILRLWRTGKCQFSDVLVNEQPHVEGSCRPIRGDLEHHDSPNLDHWYDKQNRYSTSEAISSFEGRELATTPRLTGDPLQRRMWLKKNWESLPFRHFAIFIYYFVFLGLWRAGRVGIAWSRLRSDVYRMRSYKVLEMKLRGARYVEMTRTVGKPDDRVRQC